MFQPADPSIPWACRRFRLGLKAMPLAGSIHDGVGTVWNFDADFGFIVRCTNLSQPRWLESVSVCASITLTTTSCWGKEQPHGPEALPTVLLRCSIRPELC